MNKLFSVAQVCALALNVLAAMMLCVQTVEAGPWPVPLSNCACPGCGTTGDACPATAGVPDCLTGCDCAAGQCNAK